MTDSSLQDVYTLQIRRSVNPDGGSPFCQACKNGFLHVNSIQVRQFTQTGKLPGVCKSCNNAFMRICRLQIRHLTQTEPQPHVCSTCGKSFTHAGNYRKHTLLHTNEQATNILPNGDKNPDIPKPPFNCDKCGRNFLKYGSFQKHYQNHDIVKAFRCEICDKVCKSNTMLKSHLRVHNIGPLHACKLCKVMFSDPVQLEEHLLEHVKDQMKCTNHEPGPLQEGPSETSVEAEPLKDSDKLSKGKITRSAKIISVKFSAKKGSKKQKKIKSGGEQLVESNEVPMEDKFKHFCSVCQKGFINLGALKNHFSVHTGNLAFQCRKCDRRFMHAFNLKKHAKTHRKPYTCKKCKDTFKTRSLLRNHSFSHIKKRKVKET